MDIGLLDSDSDSDGGYGLIPSQKPSPSRPDENKEEEKLPPRPVTPPATERRVARLDFEQQQFQNQVMEVQNSSLIQGLQSGLLTPEDAQRCREIIGFCPQDLLNKSVQKSLVVNGHPALPSAFKNRRIRSFVMGINSAMKTLACGMINLAIMQFLLTECVKKLGLNSRCREELLLIFDKINQHITLLDGKRRAFVLHMAEMTTSMGIISNLLRHNANTEAIVMRLESLNMDLKGKMEQIDDDIDWSKDQLFAANKQLRDYVATLGSETGDDFALFMRIFHMLNGLPETLNGLQDAFTIAATTFSSEVFTADLKFLQKGGGDVRRYLEDQTEEVHAICELALQQANQPGRALMMVNQKQAIAAIQASMRNDGGGCDSPLTEEIIW